MMKIYDWLSPADASLASPIAWVILEEPGCGLEEGITLGICYSFCLRDAGGRLAQEALLQS